MDQNIITGTVSRFLNLKINKNHVAGISISHIVFFLMRSSFADVSWSTNLYVEIGTTIHVA